MTSQTPHFINNQWVNGTGVPFASLNPATGVMLWEGISAEETEVNAAVEAANKAKEEWAATPFETRLGHLESYHDVIKANQDSLAETISQETGKPLWEAKTEIQAMMGKIDISIQAYYDRCKELFHELPSGMSITRHKPQGVIAVFGPFNFPSHIPNGHIIPALLAGNTIVFKPSEFTPLVSEAIFRCWEKCGLPEGVMNMIQGGRRTGRLLSSHKNINGLFFTGSSGIGRLLSEQYASNTGKMLALEMGGNNPLVISEVSDLEAAAYTTVQSAYITAGQRCTCARRLILIENEKSEDFLTILERWIRRIKVGPYTDTPEPFMGPVVSESAANQIIAEQDHLITEGAKPIVRMKLLKEGTGFISPGLLDVTQVEDRLDEEFFGPLLQLIRVRNLEEAIAEANNTDFGLSSGIITDSEEEFRTFYQKAQAGIINWNTQLTGASSKAPFGGIGKSGNHRPSAYYAADYCAYPVAIMESPLLKLPNKLAPGLTKPNEVET